MSGYMSIVERCLRVIINTPGGVNWVRLSERVELLGKATKREKTQVFQHLKGKNNIWNNDADDMSDTTFMSIAEAPTDAVAETSTTPVSATATAKKARLDKYSNLSANKTQPATPATYAQSESKVVNMPGVNPAADVVDHPTMSSRDIFAYNSFYTEDEVIAEMAYHVAQSAGHGITLTALRMSVPEFSECDDDDRYHLINRMRNRYGIQFYTKKSAAGKQIKVMALRREGTEIMRPSWFMNQHREVRRHFPQETSGALIARSAGSVTNNAMAEAFAKLNPAQLFATQSGAVEDEYDDDEDESQYETDGELPEVDEAEDELQMAKPTRNFLQEWTHNRPDTPTVAVAVPASTPMMNVSVTKADRTLELFKIDQPVSVDTPKPPVADILPETIQAVEVTPPVGSVTKAEVTQAADTLRLIAAQLEAQAGHSEELRKKKERFDILMRMARESSVQIQTALDNHNELLDDLQRAANDLTSL